MLIFGLRLGLGLVYLLVVVCAMWSRALLVLNSFSSFVLSFGVGQYWMLVFSKCWVVWVRGMRMFVKLLCLSFWIGCLGLCFSGFGFRL